MKDKKTNKLYRKAINFDLSVSELKTNYDKSPRNAWREIRAFLESNGFTHRQWSGYLSDDFLSDIQVVRILSQLWEKCPWLSVCATRFDVTNVGDMFNALTVFNERDNRDLSILQNQEAPAVSKSLNEVIKSAQEKADKANKKREHSRQPKKDKAQEK